MSLYAPWYDDLVIGADGRMYGPIPLTYKLSSVSEIDLDT